MCNDHARRRKPRSSGCRGSLVPGIGVGHPCGMLSKTSFLLAVLWGAHVCAHDIPAMPPAPESLLVGDMLRIDAQRARAAELAKAAQSPALAAHPRGVPGASMANPSSASSAPVPPPVALSAIYGVGAQLYADVLIRGQAVTYVAGRAQPVRIGPLQTAYRLRAIRPPCVQLDTGSKSALELCLGGRP